MRLAGGLAWIENKPCKSARTYSTVLTVWLTPCTDDTVSIACKDSPGVPTTVAEVVYTGLDRLNDTS